MPFPKAIYDSRFGRFQRVEVKAVNEGAMFDLAPMPPRVWRTIRRANHGCSKCMGFGIITDPETKQSVDCPKCGNSDTWLDDPDTRIKILTEYVKGWDGVKLYDNGVQVGDLEYTPENRALLADADAEFLAVLMAILNLGFEVENKEGKVSMQQGGQGSGDTPIGPIS